MHQLLAREKVVKKDVVMLALEIFSEVFHYSLAEMFLSTPLLASVNLKLLKVAIVAITQHPHLDASFRWLHRHILFESGATGELYHRFIDCNLFVWVIKVGKAREHKNQGKPSALPV